MRILSAFMGIAAIGAWCAPCQADSPPTDRFYKWIVGCLEGIKADLPRIGESAERAARLFVEDGYEIAAWGDPAFASEFSGRAGGLMRVLYFKQQEDAVPKTIVLAAPRQDHIESDLRQAAQMNSEERLVVLFARAEILSLAKRLGLRFDYAVDTHAAPHGGLIKNPDGKWVLPTDRIASIAALWAWTGEFVAACTRLGRMPVMWQSLSVPDAEKRAAKYRKLKFHDQTPAPIEPGAAGRDYLTAVLNTLSAVRTTERERIESVSAQAVAATASGRKFYVCGAGHATKYPPAAAHDPGVFIFLSEGQACPDFKPRDFLFLVGYDEHWLDAQLGQVSRECRRLGGKVAWTLSRYGKSRITGVEPGETIIDQHWELGDAVVLLPGYDVRILPSSGIIAEAVMWMVTERVIARR